MFAGLWLGSDKDQRGVPHEVVNLVFDNDWTPIRAWREYLTLTQAEVASRIGVSQAAYAQSEQRLNLEKPHCKK